MKKTESAGGVVCNPEGHILLVEQRHGVWSLPKGHLEEGETARQAAEREITEETGLTIFEFEKELGFYERHKIGPDGKDDPDELKTIHMFLYRTEQELVRPRDSKIVSTRWVEPSQVADLLTHNKDRAFFQEIRPQLGH